MQVRPIRAHEVDAVIAAWHATNLATYTYNAAQQLHTLAGATQFFRTQLLATCEVTVAVATVSDNAPRGVMAQHGDLVRTLAVFAPWQRSGVGSQLIIHAKQRSPTGLQLYTFQRNQPARAFYARHEFVEVAFGISAPPESEPDVLLRWP